MVTNCAKHHRRNLKKDHESQEIIPTEAQIWVYIKFDILTQLANL